MWHPHAAVQKQYLRAVERRDWLAAAQDVVVPVVPALHCVAPHSHAQSSAASEKLLALGFRRLGLPLLVLAAVPKLPRQEQSELMAMTVPLVLVASRQAHSPHSPTPAGLVQM
jgi:hypothetical protein